MYDGILLPIIRLVINSQPLEQFFFSLEYGLERGNSQRLSEAARTGEKITATFRSGADGRENNQQLLDESYSKYTLSYPHTGIYPG